MMHALSQSMHSQHINNKATMEFLLSPKNTRILLFYGQPKIYKPDCPLRPIVSGCDCPTDHLSLYITHFIQPLASNLPPHIKGTKHFLTLLKNFHPSHPMLFWSQLTSRPYTQTSHTKMAQQPSFTSWKNTGTY